jgi:hypothetical protein
MRGVTPIIPLLLMAAPAFAQAFSEDEKTVFIDTIVANGCSMTEREAEALLPPAGIDQELSGEIAVHLLDRDLATLSEDFQTFTLAAELCP